VTLKFIGEASEARLEEMKSALASVKAAPFAVHFTGVGFFPTQKAARVFWAGVDGATICRTLRQPLTPPGKTGLRARNQAIPSSSHPGAHQCASSRELQPLLADPPPRFLVQIKKK